MSKVINLPTDKRKNCRSQDDDIHLALLSVFYFIDKFEDKARGLETDLRYSLAITVYKFLCAAQKHGDLKLNKDGFSLDMEAAERLKTMVEEAVNLKSLTFFH